MAEEKKDDIILSIHGMCKSFGRNKVLDHINMDVKRGTIMGLMGENGAGKSTMMKCLFGTYQKDEGTIVLDGKEVNFTGPKDALENGIAMVHQELNQCLERSVVDNLFLGRYPVNSAGVVDETRMKVEAADLFRRLGLTVSLTAPMRTMSVSKRQMCEIAKAISYNSKIIVLDEPTSSLTVPEVEKLFSMMRKLRDEGISLIYISHKMDEILQISDEITIMRDGGYVGTYDAQTITTDEIIHHMVGRELTNQFPDHQNESGDEIMLEVKNYSSPDPLSFQDCSFHVKRGEVLGVAGLVGAQRSELMEAIFGLREHLAEGKILLHGEEKEINSPQKAIKNGMALVTEDRRESGIFGVLPVSDNIVIASLRQFLTSIGLLDRGEMKSTVHDGVESLRIKTPSAKTLISNLSGGNQQKVILSRWLATNPDLFILDEPTRGIDVGAKYEIYEIIDELSQRGKSVILISSEMSEILGMSDRIMVMCEGKIAGYFDAKEATQEKIMDLATKFMQSPQAAVKE